MSKNTSTRVTLASLAQDAAADRLHTQAMFGKIMERIEALTPAAPVEVVTSAKAKAPKAGKGKAPKTVAPKAAAPKLVTKGNREEFVKAAPWAKGMGTGAIKSAIEGDLNLLPAGWALPSGEFKAALKAGEVGKKATATVAKVETATVAKVTTVRPPACDQPRRADGTTTPKHEWALRAHLLGTGMDKATVDAKVAEAFAAIA